eukprot:COSAG01_NODE_966_length_12397_cov_146.646528_16_plen_69_part_00
MAARGRPRRTADTTPVTTQQPQQLLQPEAQALSVVLLADWPAIRARMWGLSKVALLARAKGKNTYFIT